jgi:putative SOS response-associated peptidase YedK
MCFSVNVNLVKDELENRYGASFPDHDRYQPSYYYHAFGLPDLPALCTGSDRNVRLLRWGLIPFWTKSLDNANEIRYKTFNARAESIFTKPSFSNSVRSKRCLIPVKGFFEWQHVGEDKIPWYIYHSDHDIFSLAGVFDRWVENNTGEVFETFSVITTDANELMAVIHNSKKRMPAIIEKENEIKWLDLSLGQPDVEALLKPLPSEMLKAHTISKLVNNKTMNRNTPEVIRQFNYNNRSLLF